LEREVHSPRELAARRIEKRELELVAITLIGRLGKQVRLVLRSELLVIVGHEIGSQTITITVSAPFTSAATITRVVHVSFHRNSLRSSSTFVVPSLRT
jgi:hypothetical protein